MKVAVASGKGGTGKTSVAVNLAINIEDAQFLDCDVEEPNAHLLLHPEIDRSLPVNILVPEVDEDLCNHCGKCAQFCEYNALFVSEEEVLFFPELCHSCGGCSIVCPEEAITEKNRKIGNLNFGNAGDLEVIYGELDVGEPMAVPIITELKNQIKTDKDVILDSPPGTSCPVVETVKGTDYCILVTEPTPFGLHDLKITVEVLETLQVPFGVVVNRAGLGDNKTYNYCEEKDIPILLEIPYQRKIAELYSRGTPFSSKMPEWQEKFQELINKIERMI
ncbi:MAG: ATP-binding protein [Thermoproteota archaeon]